MTDKKVSDRITLSNYDIELSNEEAKKFMKFCRLRFKDLQGLGYYLTDIPFNSLAGQTRRIFYHESLNLWKSYENK